MDDRVERPEELGREELARLAVDFFHRTIVHHALWFAEAEQQMGRAKALGIMGAVWEKSYAVQMKRLSETFGFALENGVPKALLAMPKEKLLSLLGDLVPGGRGPRWDRGRQALQRLLLDAFLPLRGLVDPAIPRPP
jgi:hypothetical protein